MTEPAGMHISINGVSYTKNVYVPSSDSRTVNHDVTSAHVNMKGNFRREDKGRLLARHLSLTDPYVTQQIQRAWRVQSKSTPLFLLTH